MLASSLAAALVDSVGAVAAARLVQGLAMSSGAVIVRSIVRDLHAHEQAARLLASMTIVFSIVPIAAPLVGALLVGRGGWRAVFWCLARWPRRCSLAATGCRPARDRARRAALDAPARPSRAPSAGSSRERRFVAPFLLILCAQIGILAWVSNSAFTLVQRPRRVRRRLRPDVRRGDARPDQRRLGVAAASCCAWASRAAALRRRARCSPAALAAAAARLGRRRPLDRGGAAVHRVPPRQRAHRAERHRGGAVAVSAGRPARPRRSSARSASPPARSSAPGSARRSTAPRGRWRRSAALAGLAAFFFERLLVRGKR